MRYSPMRNRRECGSIKPANRQAKTGIAAGRHARHIAPAMKLPAFLLFASDATIVGLWGGAFVLLALLALLMDGRRSRRKKIDAVGCMPWTFVFLAAAIIGAGMLMMAVKGWLGG